MSEIIRHNSTCKPPTNEKFPSSCPRCQLNYAAPKLLTACESFLKGWLHFCDCVDFGKSNLDADAIRFMNEVPGEIEQAAIAAAKGD